MISVSAEGKDADILEEIVEDTWNYLNDEKGEKNLHTPVIFEGLVEKPDKEIIDCYYEYINNDLGELLDYYRNNNGFVPKIYMYNVNLTCKNSDTIIIIVIMLAVIILLLLYIKKTRKKIDNQESRSNPIKKELKKYAKSSVSYNKEK